MTLLDDLKREGTLKAFWDLRRGSLLDLSGNGNTLTVTGSPTWVDTGAGLSVYTPNAGTNSLTAGNPAALQLTTATLFCLASRSLTAAGAYQIVFFKNLSFNLYFSSVAEPKAFGFYNLSPAAWTPSTYTELPNNRIHLFAGSFVSAATNCSALYVDGVQRLVSTFTLSNQTGAWNIGGGSTDQGLAGAVFLAGIVSRVLTPDEHARLYEDCVQSCRVLDVQQRSYFNAPSLEKTSSEYTAKGIVLDADCVKQRNGTLRDFTGNYPGTQTGCPTPADYEGGITTDGVDDAVDFQDVTAFNSTTRFTVSMLVRMNTSGGNPWWSKCADTNNWIYLEPGATNPALLYVAIRNGSSTYGTSTTTQARMGCWQHVVVRYDGNLTGDANRLKLNVDNNAITMSYTGGSIPATVPNLSGQRFTMGCRKIGAAAYSAFSAISVKRMRVWNTAISDAEVTAEYLRWAQRVACQVPGEHLPTTLGTSTTSLAPWEVVSGTWKVSEDSTGKRWLECVTTGTVAVFWPPELTFGTNVFTVQKTDAGSMYLMLVGSARAAWNDASQNGYVFGIDSSERIFSPATITAGAPVGFICYTANGYVAAATTYKFAVSRRRSDGRFTSWIKGGAFATWTLISVSGGGGTNPTVAESTYTTGLWRTLTCAAGDKILVFDPASVNCPHRIYTGALDPTAGELLPCEVP